MFYQKRNRYIIIYLGIIWEIVQEGENMKRKSRKSIGQKELERIVTEHSNSISLHDKYGNILLNFLGVKVSNLVGLNAKELSNEYDWSPSQKAVQTRSSVTGIVGTKYGRQQIVNATPLMDENGEVSLVIVTALDKELLDRYKEVLNKDKDNSLDESLKVTIDYLSEPNYSNKGIIAESPQMVKVLKTSKTVAKTDSTVMLIGESGTGKEVIARYIHRNSLRAQKPFIPVNCAAIPEELMESEFFGYVKGAFTGANMQGKAGLFEIADQGTLFLDEIAELPLNMQSKLLRVLESGEIKRLGDTKTKKVNVRLIAATNRNLKEMINQKLFRSDLYFRLNVIPITLPSLRSRPDDILPLAYSTLKELNLKYGLNKKFTEQAIEAFFNHSWPGNVRELRNVIERMVVTSEGDDLYLEDSFLEKPQLSGNTSDSKSPKEKTVYRGPLKSVLAQVEEDYIKQILEQCGGKVAEAAKLLGIHRSVLYRKMEKYSL